VTENAIGSAGGDQVPQDSNQNNETQQPRASKREEFDRLRVSCRTIRRAAARCISSSITGTNDFYPRKGNHHAQATYRLLVSLSLVTSSVLVSPVAHASGAVAGATEITQLLNNAELVTQVAQQAQQLATELQQYQTMIQTCKTS
jgi:hypothetical protein